MKMNDIVPRPGDQSPPRWKPLAALDRRVLGVLVEKAKTTPDGYPMSVNSLRSGCNQKNNRYPLMEVEIEDVEESLARLRSLGAVTEVQGGGRIPRFRHHLYDWLGVDKTESAVMTELLLRGAQTEGELRGRAARMEPIADVSALRPVLLSLQGKGLIVSLTPEGRGHVLTHALYEPRELEKLRAETQAATAQQASHIPAPPANPPRAVLPVASATAHAENLHTAERPPATTQAYAPLHAVEELRHELEQVRNEMAQLRKDLDDLWSNFR
jgi:uncharacterized protein YceH (UPF0502 family)